LLTSDFDYNLPLDRIAQTPVEPRHSSRLLVINRGSGELEHKVFLDLPDYLHPGDLLVMNDTRVIPARIYAKKVPGGGKIEFLLLKKKTDTIWETLVGGKGMVKGKCFSLPNGLVGQIYDVLDGAKRLVEFSEAVEPYLTKIGHVPLPPYIHETLNDAERYQTIYARNPGSAAAPTAGLHFTSELLENISAKGIQFAFVELQVGLDTFAPVTENIVQEHRIHTEWCELSQATADKITDTRRNGGRVIAVGTTSVRTIETASVSLPMDKVVGFHGPTDLFIYPGYQFKTVDAMVTNFHLPRSTLLMLVSAFAGRDKVLAAYDTAVKLNYRFFSFGDAMFIY
jgi:S-adenosylmethionine:tRNA ribosyltransferase-isomerase